MGQSNSSLQSIDCKWLLTHPGPFCPGGCVCLASRTYWWWLHCASLSELWVPIFHSQKRVPKACNGSYCSPANLSYLETLAVNFSPAKVEKMDDVCLHKWWPGPAKSLRLGALWTCPSCVFCFVLLSAVTGDRWLPRPGKRPELRCPCALREAGAERRSHGSRHGRFKGKGAGQDGDIRISSASITISSHSVEGEGWWG